MSAAAKVSQKSRLAELEEAIKAMGVKLSYEKLMFAGLTLNSGLCWFRGRYYLFVDRRKKPSERIDSLESALDELRMLAASGKLDQPPQPSEESS